MFSGDLVTRSEVPEWLRFNKFIATGYRPAPMSVPRALLSLFQWHNETVNVWSHLVPALGLFWFVLSPPMDGSIFHVCIASFLFIFSASVSYHLFMPCCSTEKSYRKLLSCDVLGALASITISAFSFLIHGYKCSEQSSVVVICFIFIVAFALLLVANVKLKLTVGQRVFVFGIFCLLRLALSIVALLPKLQTHGFHLSIYYHVSSFFILMVGGLVNALRIPERWLPSCRWMDYVMNSHNLWHFCCLWSCTWTMLGGYYDNLEWNFTRCGT
jgi:adiponectin receptor